MPFLVFVAAGSLALAAWLQNAALRESHAVFAALLRTNADFIRNAHLPASEQMMSYLGRLLNMRAFLIRGQNEILPKPDPEIEPMWGALLAVKANAEATPLGHGFEAISAPVDGNLRLALVRPVEPALSFISHRETFVVLGVFWVISVALAWAIGDGVVRPLRLLAARLPTIESDAEAVLPGAERSDEIGQLARAYLAARTQLAEERLRREKAERQALLGRMATGLAHEIHNPLSAIRMHAQLLHSAAPAELAATAEESLPTLIEETVRIEGLVNQWMFLARPEPPSMSPVNLAEFVAAVARSHQPAARHAGVRILIETTERLPAVADARRLQQAMANIVLNGIQAMQREGVLTISAMRDGVTTRLAFRDTGSGFSKVALERYRELFFSQKEGGMGIGLSVAAEILEAHGGRLEVANGADGGAVVTMVLPTALDLTIS